MKAKTRTRIQVKCLPMMAVCLGLLLSFCSPQEKAELKEQPVELKDEKAKESYSVGYQFGQNLKKMQTDLDAEVLSAGMQDALKGEESRLSDEEMRASLTNLREKSMAAMQASLKEQAEKNIAEGEKFLAENKTKEGVKTTESGLQYKVIEEGEGSSPGAGDTVTVHYRGTLIDGTEFDSSYERGQPATFPLTGVIPGWTEALQMMKTGAKWELYIPSDLAYGERGAGNRIPPNSTLIFVVELLSVNEEPTE
jgi:FKBP-type peptidyl-prolyl cis-trans isomerase